MFKLNCTYHAGMERHGHVAYSAGWTKARFAGIRTQAARYGTPRIAGNVVIERAWR